MLVPMILFFVCYFSAGQKKPKMRLMKRILIHRALKGDVNITDNQSF